MVKNFKNLLASAALVAIGVTASQGFADQNRGDHSKDQWSCSTSSSGYRFTAAGYSYDEASNSVVNMCMNHPRGEYFECHKNLDCSKIGDENPTYPQPQPEEPEPTPCPQPAPQPQPQPYPYPQPYPVPPQLPYPAPVPVYTCTTYGGGNYFWGRDTFLQQAQRRALALCHANPFSRAPECEVNLRCSY